MTRDEFAGLIEEALAIIPERFRDAMRNIAIIVEADPPDSLLAEMEIEPPDTLYGLYLGTPITERQWGDGNREPDQIVLYQGPHEEDAINEDDLVAMVAETLIHEVGHYFGMSEEEIQEVEEHFWAAQDEVGN
ncbi:MAG: metallopeptidase family protein [Acidobacteria bacterium]|nr:metallopeptidase family protein [Acidobacteriota bacterium]